MTTGETPDRTTRRARGAVATLFVVNGATYNSLVPWFPTLRDTLGLSDAGLGTAIAAFPGGALLFGVLAGPLIARFGSGRVAVGVGVVGVALLPLVALAPSFALLAGVLFLLGITDAWTDAGMNAHGLVVQRRYGRSIINALHATWSIAAVAAGLLGAGAVALGVPIVLHFGVVVVVLLGASAFAGRGILPRSVPDPVDDGGGGLRRVVTSRAALLPLLAIAVMMVCSGGVEDSASSWGAVYLRDDLAAAPFVAGLPFVAFQVAMTFGRLGGDRVVDRLGTVRVARTGALLAALALGLTLLIGAAPVAVVGFALAGLGVSTLFPLAFAAAGHVAGVRPGDGVAVVGWLARLGMLGLPPLIGTIADASSVSTGLVLVPCAAVGAALLAGSLRARR